ncbi:hypothetical protein ACN47E_001604 [Coniothyrium glycines]
MTKCIKPLVKPAEDPEYIKRRRRRINEEIFNLSKKIRIGSTSGRASDACILRNATILYYENKRKKEEQRSQRTYQKTSCTDAFAKPLLHSTDSLHRLKPPHLTRPVYNTLDYDTPDEISTQAVLGTFTPRMKIRALLSPKLVAPTPTPITNSSGKGTSMVSGLRVATLAQINHSWRKVEKQRAVAMEQEDRQGYAEIQQRLSHIVAVRHHLGLVYNVEDDGKF